MLLGGHPGSTVLIGTPPRERVKTLSNCRVSRVKSSALPHRMKERVQDLRDVACESGSGSPFSRIAGEPSPRIPGERGYALGHAPSLLLSLIGIAQTWLRPGHGSWAPLKLNVTHPRQSGKSRGGLSIRQVGLPGRGKAEGEVLC